jgi:hypothetical protein
MTDRERQETAAKRFLCRCGSTLVFEISSFGYRIICFDVSRNTRGRAQGLAHDEPTAWCASREDALQIREVIREMTRD